MAGLTIEQQLAKVQERTKALEARIAQKSELELKRAGLKLLREEKKKASDKARRVKLVGEYVLSLIGKGDVKKWLFDGLDSHLTNQEDRRLFPELPQVDADNLV